MAIIHESDLPGIGHKFRIETQSGDKVIVIVHDDGQRELYYFRRDDPDEWAWRVGLNDSEARQIAGIIGGLAYKPRELEAVELALDELVVEWYRIPAGSPVVGRSIGELELRRRTGAAIVAVVAVDGTKWINPGPEHVLTPEAMLVAIGERQQIRSFRRLMSDGG